MKTNLSLFMLLLLIGIVGCAHPGKNDVVVIKKTKSYHTEQCTRVFMAQTESMTKEQAQNLRYAACKYCKPDVNKP